MIHRFQTWIRRGTDCCPHMPFHGCWGIVRHLPDIHRIFWDGSFTSKVDYTSVTYYHKSDYEDAQLLNGIDVSWWQAKNKKTTALNWEKIHDAGIDFAFVRVASRDTSDGSIYEDTAANSSYSGGTLKTTSMIGLYIFSQALTEKEAKQEAEYVLDWQINTAGM